MYKQFILLKLLVSTSIALAGFAWAAGSPLKQVKGAADLQEDVRLWATKAAIKLRNTLDTALKE